MKLELTGQEAQSLVQLLDIAVRAQGLGAAMSALIFAERIKAAAEDESKASAETPLHAVQ